MYIVDFALQRDISTKEYRYFMWFKVGNVVTFIDKRMSMFYAMHKIYIPYLITKKVETYYLLQPIR